MKWTITTTIEDKEEWIAAWCTANGDEVDENSEAKVLKRMNQTWREKYAYGKQEQKKKETIINDDMITIKEIENEIG